MNEPKTEAQEWTASAGIIVANSGRVQCGPHTATVIARWHNAELATLRRELKEAKEWTVRIEDACIVISAPPNEFSLPREPRGIVAVYSKLVDQHNAELAYLRRELEQAKAKLTEFGAPIGDEHSTFSLAERITGMGVSKDYAWRELDKARARLAQAESDKARLDVPEKLISESCYDQISITHGRNTGWTIKCVDFQLDESRTFTGKTLREAIDKARGLPAAQEQGGNK